MTARMQFELPEGHWPKDVFGQGFGYAIPPESAEESVRYIEVKARAQSRPISRVPNEWLGARRLEDHTWLYLVEYAVTDPRLCAIRNHAA